MIKSFNSLDQNNGELHIEYLETKSYAGIDLTDVGMPAVLFSESEALCILDMEEELQLESFIFYTFPDAAKKYQIHACPYCSSHENPCSIVVAPIGTNENEPCISCRIMIEDMIKQSTFKKPEYYETFDECFAQVLDDIREKNDFNWNRYFKKIE